MNPAASRAIVAVPLVLVPALGAAQGGFHPDAWVWSAALAAWAAAIALVLSSDAGALRRSRLWLGTTTALLVWTAAVHLPASRDPSAPQVRAGRDLVWRLLAGETGRVRRPALALWTTCAALASCVVIAATAWWPLRIG